VGSVDERGFVYIMAVNADAYHQYRHRFNPADVGLPGAYIEYLHDDYQLRGITRGTVVLTSSAYLHPNYGALVRYLGILQGIRPGVRVVDVHDGTRWVKLNRGEFREVPK
jgi:hypothetical protein